MFIVASTWEIAAGQEQEAKKRGRAMRAKLREHAGVKQFVHFSTGPNEVMVVIGYEDEAAYNQIINDPNGPFQKGLDELGLEEVMTWKQSWRGTQEED